ncbi:hypothetical protein [Ochrovirga pacifica]|uniref:hypothetical protein n=1 Tax=Ochrovirga pacifica TaxID=1042376 RepID=UPI000300244B|nr:hypothetical protein [Ochrovirga pacifica]
MKNTNYTHYYQMIQKVKSTNPDLYVATYNEAKRNLVPEQFLLLQQKITTAI